MKLKQKQKGLIRRKMNKIKILLFKILFTLLLLSNSSYAKNIPPGSGIGDVPANILILLDKSGSMSVRMTSGSGFMYPYASAADSSGDIYVGQYWRYGIKKFNYSTATVDTTFASNGTYVGSGSCRSYYPLNMKFHNGFLYVLSYYNHRVYRVNVSTGACDWNHYVRYPRNLTIDTGNSILYASGIYGNGVVRNLSTNTNINCSWSGNLSGVTRYGSMAVDASGNNFYSINYNRMYRFTINQSTRCPNTNWSAQWSWGGSYAFGMDNHPSDDSIFYLNNYYAHRTEKITINSSKNNIQSRTFAGRCCTGKSTSTNIRMYYPWGVSVDKTNNRVISTTYVKMSVHVLDLNLGFLKEFGGSSGTRMDGAKEAIKAIVTDSSLTAGVNFGYAYWSSGGAGFSNWYGNITTGRAIPCSSRACLKVRVHKQGASRINQIIGSLNPGGGTNADDWARIAEDYYLSGRFSPIDKNLSCQNSYILVIGDGDWYNHSRAQSRVVRLLNKHKIKTFTVAFGGGLSSNGIRNFRRMAQAGGTNDVIIANTTASLKSQLKAAISQVIASKLSFTAPAITATIEKGGSLYQAQFDYIQNKEWQGKLTRTKLNPDGSLDLNDKGNWDASDKLEKRTSARKIWSQVPGVDYRTNYNNFVDTNWSSINTLFETTGNEVAGYHNKTDSPSNTQRCKNVASVKDAVSGVNEDDIKGLINFIRGKDYFDYDGDCNLTEKRPKALGDIYHSELVVIGNPEAETAFVGSNQESYWRSIKGYDAWAASVKRDEIIYVGANDGMLHAFNASNGEEEWAFVPPLLAASFPSMVNVNLNRSVGGSNAIYGVDGSLVAHDMYFKSAFDSSKQWHTILMVPYGRGGGGFSVLDVTNPKKPLHLYSVLNDKTRREVHVMDHNGTINTYNYIPTSWPLSQMAESIAVGASQSTDFTCKTDQSTKCQTHNVWTIPNVTLSKSDLRITIDDKNYTSFSVTTNLQGTEIRLNRNLTYYGGDPGDASKSSTNMGVYLRPGSVNTGVTTQPEYDYSQLGETWSAPRILRLPNSGAGDTNIEDDIYVAVMGGGFGTQYEGVGSNLTIVNLEDTSFPGRIHKSIPIDDLTTNDIVNSTPGTPVVITPDTARGVNYRGALVYINDLEGKITKFNLTNMSDDGAGSAISLYDSTTLFTAGSNQTNGRYMYHSMDATIGQTTNSLWLYTGTGDYERIGSTNTGTDNLMLGISDPHYPAYRDVAVATKASDLTNCKNTTKDTTGAKCPQTPKDVGWYITLDDFQKVTAEPTVSSGLVYFPIYKPSSSVNKCSLGDAFICGVDDECGTNVSNKLGSFRNKKDSCMYVGQGVLSRIVVYANKLFANIAGQSTNAQKKDLVVLDAAAGGTSSYRSSWRQNY